MVNGRATGRGRRRLKATARSALNPLWVNG